MKRTILLGVALLAVPALLLAQDGMTPQRPSVFDDLLNAQSAGRTLGIPGLTFQSSAGFTYFSGSGGYDSFGMGYYMGHFGMQIAKNLTLRWDVGVGSVMRDTGDDRQQMVFLPNVDLTYRPSSNFMIKLQYQQAPWPGYYGFRR